MYTPALPDTCTTRTIRNSLDTLCSKLKPKINVLQNSIRKSFLHGRGTTIYYMFVMFDDVRLLERILKRIPQECTTDDLKQVRRSRRGRGEACRTLRQAKGRGAPQCRPWPVRLKPVWQSLLQEHVNNCVAVMFRRYIFVQSTITKN